MARSRGSNPRATWWRIVNPPPFLDFRTRSRPVPTRAAPQPAAHPATGCGARVRVQRGEPQDERRPQPRRRRRQLERSPHLFGQPERVRESEAAALARGAGREEGVEDPLAVLVRDPAALVRHFAGDAVRGAARPGARRPGVAFAQRERRAAHGYPHLPPAGLPHRLRGVQEQVQEHLRHGGAVGEGGRGIALPPHLEGHGGVAALGRHETDRLLGGRGEVHRLGHGRSGRPREVEELAQDAPHPLDLLRRALEVPTAFRRESGVAAGEIEEREQCAHRVAHLVRHAGREASHRRQPLGAIEAGARAAQLGVRLAQVDDRLLERLGAARERVAHLVERLGELGRLARALDRHAGAERAVAEAARRGREPPQRRHDAPAQHGGAEHREDGHVGREQQGHEGHRHHAQTPGGGARQPGHRHPPVAERRREADRLPRRARSQQGLAELARRRRERERLGVGPVAALAARGGRTGGEVPPARAGDDALPRRPRRPRLRQERRPEQIAPAALVPVQEAHRQDRRGRQHHQHEAQHHLGLHAGAAAVRRAGPFARGVAGRHRRAATARRGARRGPASRGGSGTSGRRCRAGARRAS